MESPAARALPCNPPKVIIVLSNKGGRITANDRLQFDASVGRPMARRCARQPEVGRSSSGGGCRTTLSVWLIATAGGFRLGTKFSVTGRVRRSQIDFMEAQYTPLDSRDVGVGSRGWWKFRHEICPPHEPRTGTNILAQANASSKTSRSSQTDQFNAPATNVSRDRLAL